MQLRLLIPLVCWFFAAVIHFIQAGLLIFPSTFMHALQHTLAIHPFEIGRLNEAFLYAYVLMQLPAGLLFDYVSSRLLLMGACCLLMIGTIMLIVSHGFWMAIASRICMGIGGSFGFIGAIFLARTWFALALLPLLAGLTETIGTSGMICASVLFSWLKTQYPYQDILLVFVVLIACVFTGIWIFMPRRCQPLKVADKPPIMQSLHHVIRDPVLWGLGLYAGLMFVSIGVMSSVWGIEYLKQEYHFSTLHASLTNGLIVLGFMIGCPITGWLISRVNGMKLMLIAAVMHIGVMFLSFYINVPFYEEASVLFILGFLASVSLVPFTITRFYIQKAYFGVASGFINMFFGGITIVFIELSGWVLKVTDSYADASLCVTFSGIVAVIISTSLYFKRSVRCVVV